MLQSTVINSTKKLREVLEKHRGRLMAVTGIEGVAEGMCDGKPCIRVFVTEKSPQISRSIPATLEDYAVSIEETGEFKALK